MAARFSSNKSSSSRCAYAVACSSARISPNMDTAIILVVSICVLVLRVLLWL